MPFALSVECRSTLRAGRLPEQHRRPDPRHVRAPRPARELPAGVAVSGWTRARKKSADQGHLLTRSIELSEPSHAPDTPPITLTFTPPPPPRRSRIGRLPALTGRQSRVASAIAGSAAAAAAVASGVVALWPASPATPAALAPLSAAGEVAVPFGAPAVTGASAHSNQLTLARIRDGRLARRHGLRHGRIAGAGLLDKSVFLQQQHRKVEVLARQRAAQRRARLAAAAAAEAAASGSQSSGGSPVSAEVPTASW